jgi:hypothetical protein
MSSTRLEALRLAWRHTFLDGTGHPHDSAAMVLADMQRLALPGDCTAPPSDYAAGITEGHRQAYAMMLQRLDLELAPRPAPAPPGPEPFALHHFDDLPQEHRP